MGTLFLDPLESETDALMNVLQIDWLQPIYTFTFSNGLIACLVFLGIGTLLDVGFVMQRPFHSMFLAICAELGTLVTFPLGVWLGLPVNEAAATATIGGADGPMVLFASLDPGARNLRADHRRRLSVPGPDLRRLSVPDQADGAEVDPRPADADRENAADHFGGEAGLRRRRLHRALPAVPGGGAAVPVAVPGRGHPRERAHPLLRTVQQPPCSTAPPSSSACCWACSAKPTPFSTRRC